MSGTSKNKNKRHGVRELVNEESSNFALKRSKAVQKQVKTALGHLEHFLEHLNDIDEENNPYREYGDGETKIPSTYFTRNDGENGLAKFCGEFAEYLCKQKSLGSAESVKHYMKVKHPHIKHDNNIVNQTIQSRKQNLVMTMFVGNEKHIEEGL